MVRMVATVLALGAMLSGAAAQNAPAGSAPQRFDPCAVADPPKECRIFSLPGRPAAPSTGDNLQFKVLPPDELRSLNRNRDDRLRLPTVGRGGAQ
jgi:hypothetical protein